MLQIVPNFLPALVAAFQTLGLLDALFVVAIACFLEVTR